MIYLIIVLIFALGVSFYANVTQFKEINELRGRLYDADEWLAPVILEGDNEQY